MKSARRHAVLLHEAVLTPSHGCLTKDISPGGSPRLWDIPRFGRVIPAILRCSSVTLHTAVDAAEDLSDAVMPLGIRLI